VLQHTLSEQLPDVHWFAAVHDVPFDCLATHAEPVQ
jgi:hypothetical protein